MENNFNRFVEVYIQGTACNLQCSYCYLGQAGTSTSQKAKFLYTREQMRKGINIERIGRCLFNICADGETLLEPRTVEFLCDLLEEGHYAVVVTNGTIKQRFDEIASWSKEITKNILFIFSYHHIELKNRNLIDVFFQNIDTIKKAGCSYYVTCVQCDEYINQYDEIDELFKSKLLISPQIAKYRDDMDKKIKINSEMPTSDYFDLGIKRFDSNFFRFERDTYQRKVTEFCYAGDWQFNLNLCTGDMRYCYGTPGFGNLFQNPDEPIDFKALGNNCCKPYCYNGVARLPFGLVPEMTFKDYWYYTECIDENGNSSITDHMKEILSTHLYETNKEYSEKEKAEKNKEYSRLLHKRAIKGIIPVPVKRKIKNIIENNK